jgi:hypothetical protein
MALLIQLAESTQHRLRYLLLDEGDATVAPSEATIENANVAPPLGGGDLRYESHDHTPIHELVSTPVADDAAAGELLEGLGLIADPNEVQPRAHIELTAKNNIGGVGAIWAARAVEGAGGSNGYAVINIEGPNVPGSLCYLDVIFEHSVSR